MDKHVHRTLGAMGLATALVYGLSAFAMRPVWPAHLADLFFAVYFATSILGIVLFALHRKDVIPIERSQDVVASFLVLGAIHIALNVLAPDRVEQPLSALIGALAGAILLLSWRHFLVVSVSYTVAGSLVSVALLGPAESLSLIVLLVSIAIAAALLHHSRLRNTLRSEALLADNERQRRDLESALEELRLSHDQAVAREKLSALGTLVAGVAHEINNPLTYMRGNVELTKIALDEALATGRSPSAEELRELALAQAAVLRGIDRVEHITKSLKRVARGGPSERTKEDLNALVGSVLTVAQGRIPPNVEVHVDYHARRPVVASFGDLSQVLLNLLLNAAEAMPTGGTLTIATRDVPQGSLVEVQDSGPGVPEEVRARLFTPFFTTKPNGTGLGLSISHRIVEEHGGSITCENAPAGGAVFRVLLPRTAPAAPIVHAQVS